MEQADLIWHNGELVAWEDAKVHVLTHGLHYGTGVFEGIRAYDTGRGPGIFRNHDHLDRLFKSAELYYMPIPYTLEELRTATHELIAANELRECYIRPIAFRGYGQMGLFPLEAPVEVSIAVWPWGAYLGEEGKRSGVRAKVSSWRRISPDWLRGGHPSRRARLRLRGIGREHLRRARRAHPHPAADRRDPRRDQPQVDSHDRPRSRLRGHRARHRPRRALPRRRGLPFGYRR